MYTITHYMLLYIHILPLPENFFISPSRDLLMSSDCVNIQKEFFFVSPAGDALSSG